MLYLQNWSYLRIKCNSLVLWFYQIYFSKFNTYTLIINYISETCFSLSKKILELQNFVSGVPLAIFSKNTRILTVVFIGYRQLDNTFFFYLPTTCIHRYTFLFIKPFVYTTTT
jgi:hypothetical protein